MKNSGYIFPLGLLLANCELKISIANRAWSTIFEFMITTGLVCAIFDYNNKYLNVPCGLIIQFMVVLHPMIKNWLSCKKKWEKKHFRQSLFKDLGYFQWNIQSVLQLRRMEFCQTFIRMKAVI